MLELSIFDGHLKLMTIYLVHVRYKLATSVKIKVVGESKLIDSP